MLGLNSLPTVVVAIVITCSGVLLVDALPNVTTTTAPATPFPTAPPSSTTSPYAVLDFNSSQEALCLSQMQKLASSTDGKVRYGAEIAHLGCYSMVGHSMALHLNGSANTSFHSVPTSDELERCIAECQLRESLQSSLQVAFAFGVCYCAPTRVKAHSHVRIDQCCTANLSFSTYSESYCGSAKFASFYEATLLCPLKMSICAGQDFCYVSGNCCFPRTTKEPSKSVPFFVSVLQWFMAGFVILALIQIVWWTIMKHRTLRELQRQNNEERDTNGNDGQTARRPAPGRAPEEAQRLAVEIIAMFAVANIETLKQNDDDPTCTICLDSLDGSSDSVLSMPCGHAFHKDCLTSYISHKLRSFVESVTCPLCRAVAVAQDNDADPARQERRRRRRERRAQRQRQLALEATDAPAVEMTEQPQGNNEQRLLDVPEATEPAAIDDDLDVLGPSPPRYRPPRQAEADENPSRVVQFDLAETDANQTAATAEEDDIMDQL